MSKPARSGIPPVADGESRVVPFRPRGGAPSPDALQISGQISRQASSGFPASENAIDADEQDDYRHRMWVNVAAFAFTAALIGFGIWLAVSISDLRKTQDCVLMGRRDCARLAIPSP